MKFLVKDSNKIDLHIHTNCSDGKYSVPQILEEARDLGLEYISFTDHDTDEVYYRYNKKKLEKEYGVKIINGCELTVKYKGVEIHLLAYKCNPLFSKLVIPKLDFIIYSQGGMNLKKATKLIHIFGGQAVLAHPFKYNCNGKKLIESMLQDKCIDGIECVHPYHTQEEIDYLLNVCEKNNLLVTAGSDYHYKGRKCRNETIQAFLGDLPGSNSTVEKQLIRAKQMYKKAKR